VGPAAWIAASCVADTTRPDPRSSPIKLTQRRRPALFDALAHRDFRLWLIGFFLVATGDAMEKFAVGWLVVLLARAQGVSASLFLGLLGLASLIPALLLGPFAGVVIDRVDRRLLLMLSHGTSGVVLLLLSFAVITGVAAYWMVFAAAGMTTIASVLSLPTRQAIQPRLVGERDLSSAIGLNSVMLSVSWLVGPLFGGFLIGPFRVGGVLLASGLVQLLGMAAFAFLPRLHVISDGQNTGVLRSVLDGVRYVRTKALLFWLFVAFGASVLFVDAYQTLLPALASEVLSVGPVRLAWLLAANSIGGIAAGLVVGSLRRLGRFPIATVGALVTLGFLIGLFVRQREMVPLLCFIAGVGFAASFAYTSMSLFIQIATPDHLRGRVNSLLNLLIEIGMTTGTLVMGVLATAVGVDHALTFGGLALIVVCLGVASRPAIRRPRTSSERAEEMGGEAGLKSQTLAT
jgi:MFS family permease